MKLSHRKKVYYLITIVFLFISLSLFNCRGCGGGSGTGNSGSTNKSATLTWDAPTSNADGTPLTDLDGYKIYYGTSSGNYTVIIDVVCNASCGCNTPATCTYTVQNLSLGTYYFAVTAYDTEGNMSIYSNEISKTIP